MKRSITIHAIRWGAGIVLLLLLVLPFRTSAAEDRGLDAVNGILQSSSLSKTEQADVRAKSAVAISGGVPAEDVEIIVSRAVQRGADAGTINRFLDTGLATKQQGLPVGPVLDRIEQGLSKGVPLERIAAASRQLAAKIAVAQPIVDDLIRGGVAPRKKTEREAAIEAAARALEKSIPAEDLRGIGAAVHDKKGPLQLFTSAANTAAYFAGSGMSVKTSSHLVRNAVEKGYTERDLDGMVRQMADKMMRGTRAEDAAMQMEREGMRGGRGMEQQEMGGGRGMGSGSGRGSMGGPRR
jgi:hypothetical protein